jgi:signal transduction histidine kinase
MTRIKELEQARARFFRTISHELRTPLTAIRGMLENLRDDARPDQRGPLATLDEETARLARLVNELLRPPADGTLPTERRPVDLGLLASELCALQQGRARRAGIALHCTIAPDTPTIRGDRDRLKQALLNLLDNALKATSAGGEVRVSVQPAAGSQQPAVITSVEDSGPGIPAELRERVWEHGVSGAALGLEETGGAGLGLALVREIVAAHGGRAYLEPSEALGGARFVITLQQ